MASNTQNAYVTQYLSLEQTLHRIHLFKRDIEVNTMFKLSKGTIQKIRIGQFSSPSQSMLSSCQTLKSKTQKSDSVASEETRDEDFQIQDAPESQTNKINFEEIFTSKMKKKIVKRQSKKTMSKFGLARVKKTVGLARKAKKINDSLIF